MWFPKALLLCVLLAGTAPTCSPWPLLWYSSDVRENYGIQLPEEPNCDAHPIMALARSPHGSPRNESAITFVFTDWSDSSVVDVLCPGVQYILTVSFDSDRLGLLTASPDIAANFTSPVPTPDCKNRVALGSRSMKSAVYNTSFRVSCHAAGSSVLFKVTSAASRGDAQWRQNSIGMPVAPLGPTGGVANGRCGATSAACSLSIMSPPPLNPVLPSPLSAPPPPPPSPAPTSAYCNPSPLGYHCMAKQGKVTIHWSFNTPAAPPNTCTAQLGNRTSLQPSQSSDLAADGSLHLAVEAEAAGYVALGFGENPDKMAPADIALGWAGSGTSAPYFRTFHVKSSWLSERNIYPPPGSPGWAYDSGVIRNATTGITTICFSRRLRDDRAPASSDLRAPQGEVAGGRRALAAQDVIGSRTLATDGFAAGSRTLAFIWAVSDAQGLVQHTAGNVGGFWLDPTSGSTADSAGYNKRYWINVHGALMAVAWGLLLPLGTLFPAHRWVRLGQRVVYGKQLWFLAHLATQWTGMILFIAGFVVAFTKLDGGGSEQVRDAHENIGIAIMAAAGAQVVLAFIRPPPPSPGETLSARRRVWNFFHHNLGRSVVLLAWANVYIGIYVYHTSIWAASYTPWITPIAIVMGLLVILDVVLRILAAKQKPRSSTTQQSQPSKGDTPSSPADQGIDIITSEAGVAVVLDALP